MGAFVSLDRFSWRLRLVMACALAEATPATAQEAPCPPAETPALGLIFRGNVSPALREAMARDLHAGLADRGLRVCWQSPPDSSWVARVTLLQNADATITIEVDDRWTNKRVLREISVRREADGSVVDAEGLTLAVATEELLRATWAELDLDAAAQAPTSTPAPRPSAEESTQPSRRSEQTPSESDNAASPLQETRWRAGLGGRALMALRHQATWGAFAFLGSHFGTGGVGETLNWTLAVAGQWGRAPSSSLGRVELWGVGADLLLDLPLFEVSQLSWGPSLGSSVQHWTFVPEAEDGVGSSTARSWVWLALGGLSAQRRWTRHQLGIDLLAGGAVRGADVTDGARVLAGWSGVVLDGRVRWGLMW